MTIDLMLDTESFSTRANPVLLSIALVPFDFNGSGRAAFCPTFHRYLELPRQVEMGLHMDPSTVMWWMGQEAEARQAQTCADRLRPDTVAIELQSYLAGFGNVRVWAYGAAEDHVWLRSFYRAFGYECPISYRNARCLRTLADMAGLYKAAGTTASRHNAYLDCIDQIAHAQESMRRLTPAMAA